MPTIGQLPPVSTVSSDDQLPLSQSGSTRSVSVGTLLGSTQPAISAPTGALLGRVSIGAGGPEAVAVGSGLALQGTTLLSTVTGVTGAPPADALGRGDRLGISVGGADRSLTAAALTTSPVLVPTGAVTPLSFADHAARVVNPRDFGAAGDGIADDLPAFQAAAASVPAGTPVQLRVTRGTYYLSGGFVATRATVLFEEGAVTTGPGYLYVARSERLANGHLTVSVQGAVAGNGSVHADVNVVNNGPSSGYGETFQYQAFLNTTGQGYGGDIARSESARWHGANGSGMMLHWFVGCTPGQLEAPGASYGLTLAEWNPVNLGPDYGWHPDTSNQPQWASGMWVVPDAGGQFNDSTPDGKTTRSGYGGNILFSYGAAQNGGGLRPARTYNAFLVLPDAVAPGGYATFATGAPAPAPATNPKSPLGAAGNWLTGLRLDRAVLGSSRAIEMAANHAVAWVDGDEQALNLDLAGTGNPNGAVSAPVGSVFRRRDGAPGGTLWVKESGSGNTGWAPASTATDPVTHAPQVAGMAATDLVGISQNGGDRSISLGNLLAARAIDAAVAAGAASDNDAFWTAQGSGPMSRQTLAAVWGWITSKLPGYRLPVVELTADTVLDASVHNGRVLVCSRPLTLSPGPASRVSGFNCEVQAIAAVTFAGGITGASGVVAGGSAKIRAFSYSGGDIVSATAWAAP